MCVLEHNFFLCSSKYDPKGVHYKSEVVLCSPKATCRPDLIRYKLHFKVCGSVHCSMSMYWKADHGEINCATWALNTDCDTGYQDREDPYSGDDKGDDDDDDDDDMEEIVIENPNQVAKEKAVHAIRWMEGRYPEKLTQIRLQVQAGYLQGEQLQIRQQAQAGYLQGEQLSSGQLLTKVVSKEEQEYWADVDELNGREWQAQQAQQAQLYAQQYAYQQHYASHHQLQYTPDQYYPQSGYHPSHPQPTLPSSSSGHYLPPPHSTLYLTAPDDYDGHDGHAGVSDVPGVAGLLTAPPSAGKASGSKSSSSSRSKDASKHGKTEKKREPEREDKGRTGGKEKRRR